MLSPGFVAVCSHKGGHHLRRVLSPLAPMSEPSAFLSSTPHLPLHCLLSFLPWPPSQGPALSVPTGQWALLCHRTVGPHPGGTQALGMGVRGGRLLGWVPLHCLHSCVTLCWLLAPEPWCASFKSQGWCWEIPWTEVPGGLQSLGCKESDATERVCACSDHTLHLEQCRARGRHVVFIHSLAHPLIHPCHKRFIESLCTRH